MADYSKYSTILFMDSMVALEGKPLPNLPWAEVDAVGPILVLVVPQVGKEIDSKKRDGRLAKKAREFNRLIAPAAQSGSPIMVCKGQPEVFLGTATCDRVNWDILDDLDPGEGDARLVAQVLNARDVELGKRILLTHDINPIAMASRHGLRSRKLPEHWLQEPEPSPDEREKARLKERISQLEASEPDLKLKISFDREGPLEILKVAPLEDADQREYVERVIRGFPKHQDDPWGINRDYSYSDRYDTWRSKIVPEYSARLNQMLEVLHGQIRFRISLSNEGFIQAEHLVLAIKAVGGTLHDKFSCFQVWGPSPPKYHPDIVRIPRFQQAEHQPNRHEMYFSRVPDRSSLIEVQCADFRHGRNWDFNGVATIQPGTASPFKLVVTLSAANMRGVVTEVREISFSVTDATVAELLDWRVRKWLKPFPLEQEFEDAIKSKKLDWLYMVRVSEDEDDEDD